MRLFIAIFPPKEVQEELAAAQASLAQIAGLKLVEKDNLHLTLKFLGETEEPEIKKIQDAVSEATKGKRAFEVAPKDPGTFPSEKRPRVVWIGFEDSQKIVELQKAIDAELAKFGYAPEKEFTAHLTLARVKAKSDFAELAAAIEKIRGRPFSSFKVQAVVLMKSTLTKKGPIYEEVARFELEPA